MKVIVSEEAIHYDRCGPSRRPTNVWAWLLTATTIGEVEVMPDRRFLLDAFRSGHRLRFILHHQGVA